MNDQLIQNWKLSPSDLTFLWDECKRCFYLKVKHDFRRPSAPFPKIFGLIDGLMKNIYLEQSTKKLSPTLPEGKSIMAGRWVTSEPIRRPGRAHACYIQGIFDTAVRFEDETYGVVDFKTTTVKDEHVLFYSRQLWAYAYALEHPMPGKLHLEPITRLGLLCFDPQDMLEEPGTGLSLLGPATWVEIPKDEDAFLSMIDEVLDVLEMSDPPEAGPDCGFCTYRDASRITDF